MKNSTIDRAHPISETPGVCGGKPCLTGHRITMAHFNALVDDLGWSYERILQEYPHVDATQFYEAMALWRNATNWRTS